MIEKNNWHLIKSDDCYNTFQWENVICVWVTLFKYQMCSLTATIVCNTMNWPGSTAISFCVLIVPTTNNVHLSSGIGSPYNHTEHWTASELMCTGIDLITKCQYFPIYLYIFLLFFHLHELKHRKLSNFYCVSKFEGFTLRYGKLILKLASRKNTKHVFIYLLIIRSLTFIQW